MQNIYSIGEVARLLGLQIYQISYAHSTGQIEEPGLRFCGKRAYTDLDIRQIAEHFEIDLDDSVLASEETR